MSENNQSPVRQRWALELMADAINAIAKKDTANLATAILTKAAKDAEGLRHLSLIERDGQLGLFYDIRTPYGDIAGFYNPRSGVERLLTNFLRIKTSDPEHREHACRVAYQITKRAIEDFEKGLQESLLSHFLWSHTETLFVMHRRAARSERAAGRAPATDLQYAQFMNDTAAFLDAKRKRRQGIDFGRPRELQEWEADEALEFYESLKKLYEPIGRAHEKELKAFKRRTGQRGRYGYDRGKWVEEWLSISSQSYGHIGSEVLIEFCVRTVSEIVCERTAEVFNVRATNLRQIILPAARRRRAAKSVDNCSP